MIQPVKFQANAVDFSGNVLPLAQVTVQNTATSLLPLLYSDLNNTPLANPFYTGSDGLIEFYCEGQVVNITAEKNGQTVVWSDYFTNTQGALNKILTENNTFAGSNLFNQSVVVPSAVITTKYVEGVSGANSGDSLRVGSSVLLNDDDLSSSNSIGTEQDRGASRLGIESMMTRKFNSDLGTAAYADLTTSTTDVTAGGVLKTGDGDFLLNTEASTTSNINTRLHSCFFTYNDNSTGAPTTTRGTAIQTWRSATSNSLRSHQLIMSNDRLFLRRNNNGTWLSSVEFWSTENTIVDVNDFIKQL